MKIVARKLISRVKLQGRRFTVFEDTLMETGAAFTVVPPETAEFLELRGCVRYSEGVESKKRTLECFLSPV